jgi:hypothetical protein
MSFQPIRLAVIDFQRRSSLNAYGCVSTFPSISIGAVIDILVQPKRIVLLRCGSSGRWQSSRRRRRMIITDNCEATERPRK